MADWILPFLRELWGVTTEMAPYLLLGFLVASVLSALISPRTVERHLGGRGLGPITKATLFGVPLPLCSCGVIPVGASLRQHGASRGATASFLLSTPQTGVDSILVTWSLLGPVFAVFRPLVALVTGIVGGLVVDRTAATKRPRGDGAAVVPASSATAAAASQSAGRRSWRDAARYGFVSLPRDIGTSLLVGVVAAAAIGVFVPEDFLGSLGAGWLGYVAALAIGIPLYVCATGSVPIAAALIAKGLSPGAAFVFLMTGPATNVATIATVWTILGRRAAVAYLAVVGVGAIAAGALLDGLGIAPLIAEHAQHHQMAGASVLATVFGVLLVLVVGHALLRRDRLEPAGEFPAEGDRSLRLSIDGMHCGHCVQSVERALRESQGVEDVAVSLDDEAAVVRGGALAEPDLRKAIEKLGFRVRAVSKV